jgi:hypothetical protein
VNIELSTKIVESVEVPGGDCMVIVEVRAKKGNKEISMGHYDIPWNPDRTTEDDFFEKVNLIEEECLVKAERAFKGQGQSHKAFIAKYKDKNLHPTAEQKKKERQEKSVPLEEV